MSVDGHCDNSPGRTVSWKSESKKILLLCGIFTCSFLLLTAVYVNCPNLDEEEKPHVKLPRNVEDAKQLGRVLSRYKSQYYWTVLTGVIVTYIFLQSFAIPGSIFLTILSGYLFRFPVALFLVCTCSAVGATICYLLSYLIGRSLVQKYFPERVTKWSIQVTNHREHLLNYIVFLRITPFLPNWFINVASPVIDVPMSPFYWGTFFGVAPPSAMYVQAGQTLNELTDGVSAVSWTSVALLAALALASLLPVVCKRRLARTLKTE